MIRAAREANMEVVWYEEELLGVYRRMGSGKISPPHFHVGNRHIPLESNEVGRKELKFLRKAGGR